MINFPSDDSYYSTDRTAIDEGEDDDLSDEDFDNDGIAADGDELDAKIEKKVKKKGKHSGLKQEIADLNDKYELGDTNRTFTPERWTTGMNKQPS